MQGLSKIFLMGNLGGDPKLKNDQGILLAKLSLAVNEQDKGPNGEDRDHLSWFTVIVAGQWADFAGKSLRKGMPVHVEGKMRQKTYTNAKGVQATAYEVIGESIRLLGR